MTSIAAVDFIIFLAHCLSFIIGLSLYLKKNYVTHIFLKLTLEINILSSLRKCNKIYFIKIISE